MARDGSTFVVCVASNKSGKRVWLSIHEQTTGSPSLFVKEDHINGVLLQVKNGAQLMHVVENVRRYKVRERAIIGACNIIHVRVDVLSHANTEISLSYNFPEVKVNVQIAVTILLC